MNHEVIALCPCCKRKYGHLDGCQVAALHEMLDNCIALNGWSNVSIEAYRYSVSGPTFSDLKIEVF